MWSWERPGRGVQEGLKKAVLEPGRDINKVLSSREDGGSVVESLWRWEGTGA